MIRLLLPLLAAVPLLACTEETGNRANLAAINEIAVTPEPGANAAGPTGDGVGGPSEGAAPQSGATSETESGDVPIKGQASRPAGPPPADEADACGASRYQWLVGRRRSEIPSRPAGATWRIACTGCPITMDYSAGRLNIFYDAETERIDEVRCG